MPDLCFESGETSCQGSAPGHGASCTISGTMKIRGVSHALSLSVRIRQGTKRGTFRATGDAIVKLSDYGIVPPSQFGVKTSDEVVIHLDLSGKESILTTALSGGR